MEAGSKRTPKKRGGARRELRDLIETCVAIENRRFNPFLLNISEALRILRLHAEEWTELGDHLLDMKALASLAKVVGLQSANLRFQSSTLYVDPSMLRDKLLAMSRDQLAEFLLLSWHPIVEFEQLTTSTAREALDYWTKMLPFFDRWKRFQPGPIFLPLGTETEELHRLGLMADKAFGSRLDEFWIEMKKMTGTKTKIDYWAFVKGQNRSETVSRAQLTSFLVTYGYATLESENGQLTLAPKERRSIQKEATPESFPITIPQDVS